MAETTRKTNASLNSRRWTAPSLRPPRIETKAERMTKRLRARAEKARAR